MWAAPIQNVRLRGPTTAEAQLARWAWFDDETTFVYLMARVDDSGLACDQIAWNVGNIARDDSTSKKPLLADILNPTAIVIHDDLPHPTAICHIARDGDAILGAAQLGAS